MGKTTSKTKAKKGEWRACSVTECHCHGSDHLHVETPYGCVYGPREAMEKILEWSKREARGEYETAGE